MKLESNGVRIAAGQTVPGSTDWKQYEKDNKSIMVDVDTSSGGFKNTPLYFTSIGGREDQWQTIGVTSIYDPTPTGFRVYVQRMDDKMKPEDANWHQWHINWIGIEG